VTTYTYATLRTRSVLARLAERVTPVGRALRQAARRGWATLRPVAMTLCGLTCITAGLFTVSVLAGLIAAGVSFFIVEWVAR